MVNQKTGMEDIVSDKRIFVIDGKGKTDIVPVNLAFALETDIVNQNQLFTVRISYDIYIYSVIWRLSYRFLP
jgi:hypothetical protein